jgi:hypothetical protein
MTLFCVCVCIMYTFRPCVCNDAMKQSPSWEADSHSASPGIRRLLWNPKVHYRVHKVPPLVPILSQISPVHTFPPYIPKIHCNVILLSNITSTFRYLGRSEESVQLRGPVQHFVISFFFLWRRVISSSPTPEVRGPPIVAVRDCLFHIFAATLHIWSSSSPSATRGSIVP